MGAALNLGMEWAADHGFSWVALFDQDSAPYAGMVPEVLRAAQSAAQSGVRVAIAAANWIDRRLGQACFPVSASERRRGWMIRTAAISSGEILSVSAYRALGPFEADWFIDNIDIEYGFRATRRGYRVVVTTAVLMAHHYGDEEGNHPAWREYYMARNTVWLIRRYWCVLPCAVTKVAWHWGQHACAVIRRSRQSRANTAMVMAGFLAGLSGTRRDPAETGLL